MEWRGGQADRQHAPDCPWQNNSSYTITGQSEADFTEPDAKIISAVQVFQSSKQALGDLTVGSRPGTAACEGSVITQSFGKSAKLLSARSVAAPKIGDRALEFEFAIKFGAGTYYVNVIEFVRDRSLGGLITLNAATPLAGREALAALMDERLRSGTVA